LGVAQEANKFPKKGILKNVTCLGFFNQNPECPAKSRSGTPSKLHPDVLVPQFRPGLDEIAHDSDALGVLHNLDLYALTADVILGTLESDIFPDDDVGDFVKKSRAAAHGAGRESGIKDALGVNAGGQAAGVFQAIHLGMVDDAAVLDPLVVAAPDDLPPMDEHGADGYATGGKALAGFLDCGAEERVALRHERGG